MKQNVPCGVYSAGYILMFTVVFYMKNILSMKREQSDLQNRYEKLLHPYSEDLRKLR